MCEQRKTQQQQDDTAMTEKKHDAPIPRNWCFKRLRNDVIVKTKVLQNRSCHRI